MKLKTAKALRHCATREILKEITSSAKGLSLDQLAAMFSDTANATLAYRLKILRDGGLIQKKGRAYVKGTRFKASLLDMDDNIAWAMASETSRYILKRLSGTEPSIAEICEYVKKQRGCSKSEVVRCLRELRLRGIVAKGYSQNEIITMSITEKYKKFLTEVTL